MSVTPSKAAQTAIDYIAKNGVDNPQIIKAFDYNSKYVFFLQPNGADPSSKDAVMDCFCVIDSESGEILSETPFAMPGFFQNAKELPEEFYK